jgi:uncharacterized protein YndB with AHSA1/START domain
MTKEMDVKKKGVEPFVISRSFDAPCERMWSAWTEREQLMQWFGPRGFTMPAAKLEFRPGGVFHYCLESAEGQEIWGKFTYREIVPAERISFVSSFSDEDGNVTRHPLSATWPLEMLSRITFTEQGGRTTVIVEWTPLNSTDAERKTFETGHAAMQQGWAGTFDQLADHLAKHEVEAA